MLQYWQYQNCSSYSGISLQSASYLATDGGEGGEEEEQPVLHLLQKKNSHKEIVTLFFNILPWTASNLTSNCPFAIWAAYISSWFRVTSNTTKSNCSSSTGRLCLRACVWRMPVRKPCGEKKPGSQYEGGGPAVNQTWEKLTELNKRKLRNQHFSNAVRTQYSRKIYKLE
jgi:hypothetical protein